MSKETQNQPAPSMQDILEDLRGVIAGEKKPESLDAEMDVLELTEEPVQAQAAAPQEAPPATSAATIASVADVSPNSNPSPDVSAINASSTQEASNNVEVASVQNVTPAPEVPLAEPNKENNAATDNPQNNSISPTTQDVPVKQEAEIPEKLSLENTKLLDEKVISESSSYIKQLVNTTSAKSNADTVLLNSNVRLEDIVKESIKPYLADWLDKNLSTIVKEIVTKEIKRIIPKDE